jgi:hypothetical protein
MTKQTDSEPTRQRLLRSARVLKVYFERKLQVSLELLTEAPEEPVIDGIQFDLQISRWGIWGLRASGPLPEKTQTEISATFHGLLGAMDSLEDRRYQLARLQEHFESTMEELPSNVIPLRPRPTMHSRAYSRVHDKRWILRLDCLIESQQISEIHKMALELHSHSQRYAFVEYCDLSPTCRGSLTELLQLGAISLFVPSILDLSANEQEVLRQLVKLDTLNRPLLMVGANLPYSELRGEAAINLDFLLLLSRAYIKLTRPFAEYKDKGLIHYFLDSLAQSPT